MTCERCGNNFADDITICPHCGTLRSQSYTKQPATDYGSFASGNRGDIPLYQQGYIPPASGSTPAHTQYVPPGSVLPSVYPGLPPRSVAGSPLHVTVINSNMQTSALVIEILLSLFGIFGIGWIIGGEITLGIILVVCSFFIYWPLMILGTALTEGLGLICLGPLAIAAIILNAVLLNTVLKRKLHRLLTMQQQASYYHYMPPQ
jgi:hypothetical protein